MSKEKSAEEWDKTWQDGVSPGEKFDKSYPAPALLEEMTKKWMPDGTGTALVPGMGRGYDVEALSRGGRYARVIGLDIAPTAVSIARAYLSACDLPNTWEVRCADFFKCEGIDRVNLIIDHSFLCALSLAARPRWAERMRDLLAPGGSLITLIHHLGKTLDEGGPPFGVSFEDYHELLGKRGFQAVDGPRLLPDDLCHEGRQGRSGYARWVRGE